MMKTGQRFTAAEFRNNPALLKQARLSTSAKSQNKNEESEKKRSKYGAKKVTIDGIVFDSKLEGKRYTVLKILEKSGEISDLELQVKYDLSFNGVHICNYYADFVYQENGKKVVEDAKGMRTKEYNLKKKMMKAVHGIDIFESNIKHTK